MRVHVHFKARLMGLKTLLLLHKIDKGYYNLHFLSPWDGISALNWLALGGENLYCLAKGGMMMKRWI